MARRRLFQISLRTLLALTTLVAIGLGFLTRVQHRVQEQRLAVARIKALGGQVVYDYQEGKSAKQKRSPSGWPWLRKLVGDEYFQDVTGITLEETTVSNADLSVIGELRGMKSLSLRGLEKPRDGKRYLIRLSGPNYPVPPAPSKITSDGIRRLGHQPNLRVANLANTLVDDVGTQMLAQWPLLENVNLACTQVTSNGVQRLERLEHLNTLNLAGTKVDDDAVASLCRMRTLERLALLETDVSGSGLFKLRAELPSCQLKGDLLDLSSGVESDPQSMRWKEMTRHMWRLGRSRRLKLLILSSPTVTDEHLDELDHRLGEVDVVDLRHSSVTDAGVETMQRALPKCKIVR